MAKRYSTGKTRLSASFFFAVSLVVGCLVLAGCSESELPSHSYAGDIMGTTYHVKVVADPVAPDLESRIHGVLADVDNKMSTYKPASELNRLNEAPPGQSVAVSPELVEVLALSRQVYKLTDGAFDPTVGPLVDLWGFGPGGQEEQIPDESLIGPLVAQVGFSAVRLDEAAGSVVKKRPRSLDLSAVAKGYAVDKVGALLADLGIDNYMVEVGGEMAVSGHNDRGTPWQIAIEKPLTLTRSVQQVVSVASGGIATSGDYRNYFEQDGVRYSHTIDPRTGYPISHALASVTVISDNCALSDALATAFMVLGTEKTLALAEQQNIAVFTLSKTDNGFEAAHSSAFEPYLQEVQ